MGERWTRPDRFRPDELDGDVSVGEGARVMATARELEWLAAADDIRPTGDFADRVMAAIAAEPTPRPVVAAASAARRGAVFGVIAAFRDLWRVATTGGRPFVVRAPAMALVVLVLAGTLGAGALGVGALSSLVNRADQTPAPSPVVSPAPQTPSPTPEPSPTPSPSPGPSESPRVTESPEPTETPAATETPEQNEAQGAPATPRATDTPEPTEHTTPRPSRTPRPTETPEPTKTPKPSETPHHDSGD